MRQKDGVVFLAFGGKAGSVSGRGAIPHQGMWGNPRGSERLWLRPKGQQTRCKAVGDGIVRLEEDDAWVLPAADIRQIENLFDKVYPARIDGPLLKLNFDDGD